MSTFTCGYCDQTQLVFDDSPALPCCNDSNNYGCSGVYEDGDEDDEDFQEDNGDEEDFQEDNGDEEDFQEDDEDDEDFQEDDEDEEDFQEDDEDDEDFQEDEGDGEDYDNDDPDDAVDTADVQYGTRVRTATTFFDPCAQHLPGANNGSTAGRRTDGYDRGYNGR